MSIRAIALQTFTGFLRNKILILFSVLFAAVVLIMMTPLLAMKAMPAAAGAGSAEATIMSVIGAIMALVSGFGSLLAGWTGADAVHAEIRSGTILAVLARPVRRWEFLFGKYLGVQLLMACYILMMLALSYLLAAIGGSSIQPAVWLLLLYPLVRYALYSALAILLGSRLHPVVAFAVLFVIMILESIVAPGHKTAFLPEWIRGTLQILLPSSDLLSETRFFTFTSANLTRIPPLNHLTALLYGLDWAVVFFLLAVWAFQRRNVARD